MRKIIISILFLILLASIASATEYTPVSEQYCNDGICNLVQYGQTKFVFEDNQWKDIKDAKSLKGKGFEVVYLENDPSFKIIVNDFNYTSIDMDLEFLGNPEDYPDFCAVDKDGIQATCDFKVDEKWEEYVAVNMDVVEKSQLKFQYKWERDKTGVITKGDKYKFEYKGNPFGKKFKFGGNSTTIRLVGNASVMDDSFVEGHLPDTNYGSSTLLNLYYSFPADSYLRFNISDITDIRKGVLNATLYLTVNAVSGMKAKAYHVFSNVTWSEETLTFNNAPCSAPATDGHECNSTFMQDSASFSAGVGGLEQFDVTPAVEYEFSRANNNVSILLDCYSYVTDDGAMSFYSKEADASYSPFLNITYRDVGFYITAKDIYDNSVLNNFTVSISNATMSMTNYTTGGGLSYGNITNGLFDINITNINNGTYFNRTYLDYNVSANLNAEVFQSLLNLHVTDLLTGAEIESFSVTTNYSSYSSTDGYILLYSKEGTKHILNISSTSYPMQQHSYAINALDNITMTVNMSPKFNFFLRREADNSVFDWDSANTTKMTIYCPDKNIVEYFNESSEKNVTVDCDYTLMKIDVSYPSGSYFRTLIPETSQTNVTWYLLDLNLDTGVEIILELIDLTGDWSDGLIRIRSAIQSTTEDIIEQEFDISTSIVAYLLKDALYTITIINSDGAERTIGNLIADAAGTKTITYPDIPFYPEDAVMEDEISWSYTFNTIQQILRLQYEDETASTSYLKWDVYNGSNTSLLLSSFTATSNSSLVFTYQPISANQTYSTILTVEHPDLDFNITEGKVFGEYQEHLRLFEGFENRQDIAMYVSIIFLVVWGLLFSSKHVGIGLVSTFIWALVLRIMGFLPIKWSWLSLIGVLAVIGWLVEMMRK